MADQKFRPMNQHESIGGCPMIIETTGKKNEKPGKSSKAEKGDFIITSGTDKIIPAGNVTCIKDDKGNISYKIEQTHKTEQSHDVRN